ncbi:MAG: hypothetical protein JOZ10_17415 [Acidobacteria bacterium]|nr:hypothetical protein [Acidobacteriota bacterium]MBV9147383.1 hypothetical protein [Acidobacteriota bacterium]MBV9437459.1 hypothetical protein [Acidobacteriota bacterium]
MKTIFQIGLLLMVASLAFAKDEPVFHQTGTITNMDAVPCGVDENSGKSFAGEILGTDGAHKKSREMLCQEYVLKTDTVMYRIRPRDDKHPVLLPVGERASFRIKKDKLLLAVAELDGKEREYSVTSMQMLPSESRSTAERAAK